SDSNQWPGSLTIPAPGAGKAGTSAPRRLRRAYVSSCLDPQHVALPRPEADVVAADAPVELLIGQQLRGAVCRRQAQPDRDRDDALLLGARVQVHAHEHDV